MNPAVLITILAALIVQPISDGALTYLGSIEENRKLLHDDRGGDNLFWTPETAFILIDRKSSDTRAWLEYSGGRRSLPFAQNRAQLRVMIQKGQKIVITGESKGRECYRQPLVISESGVWNLRLSC